MPTLEMHSEISSPTVLPAEMQLSRHTKLMTIAKGFSGSESQRISLEDLERHFLIRGNMLDVETSAANGLRQLGKLEGRLPTRRGRQYKLSQQLWDPEEVTGVCDTVEDPVRRIVHCENKEERRDRTSLENTSEDC